ncbi:MAG: hypothetical protein COA43_00450 [Robiginitomaculum sp.]|nr:MAG: hypothetical protein COA43_00450 [Robiginitomaculum sp.]
MPKFTSNQRARHQEALSILKYRVRDFEAIYEFFEKFDEAFYADISKDNAYFTPVGLARDISIAVGGRRVLDVAAGIGVLSCLEWHMNGKQSDVVCIEQNPKFVEIGRKIFPEAHWICGDMMNPSIYEPLGTFDTAVSNPPFGSNKSAFKAPRYKGASLPYHIIDLLSDIADEGVFILPDRLVSDEFRGGYVGLYDQRHYTSFVEQTHIKLGRTSIDAGYYCKEWKHTKIDVHLVTSDFRETRRLRDLGKTYELFGQSKPQKRLVG